jgi:hypothetical protein
VSYDTKFVLHFLNLQKKETFYGYMVLRKKCRRPQIETESKEQRDIFDARPNNENAIASIIDDYWRSK